MRQVTAITGINIASFFIPCAHQCRYCFFDNHKSSKYPFNRFAAVGERFFKWRETQNLPKFDVIFRRGYCDEVEPADIKKENELAAFAHTYRPLYLGGLRMQSEYKMRTWLQQLIDMKIKVVYVSFAGDGAVHDHWNGRSGDFDFLFSTMKIAADLGMDIFQRIFLMKSTLPTIEKLVDKLDDLPMKVKKREIIPLLYSGRARYLEDERVTTADLEAFPERVTRFFEARKNWRTEREWINIISQEKEPPPIKILLTLNLDDTNIDRIESMSCEEIIGDLESRTRAAYNMLPAPRKLCEECGDATNYRLYKNRSDIERLWFTRYLEKHPLRFEQQLTYLTMNN